jgi:hypothetical protein
MKQILGRHITLCGSFQRKIWILWEKRERNTPKSEAICCATAGSLGTTQSVKVQSSVMEVLWYDPPKSHSLTELSYDTYQKILLFSMFNVKTSDPPVKEAQFPVAITLSLPLYCDADKVQLTFHYKQIVILKNALFWDLMTLCSSCKNRCFKGLFHLHF